MQFAQRLRHWRKKAGLTQEQLALACGYSGQSRIGNYELAGENSREPPLSDLPILARALNIPVARPSTTRSGHAIKSVPRRLPGSGRATSEAPKTPDPSRMK